MQKKDTESLLCELKRDASIDRFLSENQEEFIQPLHTYLEDLLSKKHLEKNKVIHASQLDRIYAYQIFSGQKPNPSRSKLLAIALAMQLSLNEVQYLLRYAGLGALYPRNPWDAIIISAIEQQLSVSKANDLLGKIGETQLLR